MNLQQAEIALSGLGVAVLLPPNGEQRELGVRGIAYLKTYTNEHVLTHAFMSEKDVADFRRFKKVLKRKEVEYRDGTAAEVVTIAL